MLTEKFLEGVTKQVEEHLKGFEVIQDANRLGLDPRSGYKFWIGDQHIVVEQVRSGSLNYYGGFEYVDREHITSIGGYVFYAALDSRVAEALDLFHDRPPSDEVAA